MFEFLTTTSYTFEDKKSYENVLLFLYRHWFVLFLQLIAFALLGILPLVLAIVLNKFLPELEAWRPYLHFAYAIYYLFWWYGLFYRIAMYLLDYWIVTDHRIIDSEQHGFFNRTVAELNLAKIQDISVAIIGVIPTWLDYGNLEVQTAAASEKFFFKEIPHPEKTKDIIRDAHNTYIKEHPGDVETHV